MVDETQYIFIFWQHITSINTNKTPDTLFSFKHNEFVHLILMKMWHQWIKNYWSLGSDNVIVHALKINLLNFIFNNIITLTLKEMITILGDTILLQNLSASMNWLDKIYPVRTTLEFPHIYYKHRIQLRLRCKKMVSGDLGKLAKTFTNLRKYLRVQICMVSLKFHVQINSAHCFCVQIKTRITCINVY